MQQIWIERPGLTPDESEPIIDVSLHADHRTAHLCVSTPTRLYHVRIDRVTFEAFVNRVAAIHADKTALLPFAADPAPSA